MIYLHILSTFKVVNACGVLRWGLEFCGVLLLFLVVCLIIILLLLLTAPPAGETCFLSQWTMFPCAGGIHACLCGL